MELDESVCERLTVVVDESVRACTHETEACDKKVCESHCLRMRRLNARM